MNKTSQLDSTALVNDIGIRLMFLEIVSQDCITGYIKGPPSRPLRRRGRSAIRRSPFRAAALDALVAIPTLPLDQGVMSKPGEESSKFRVLSFTESLGEDIGDLLI